LSEYCAKFPNVKTPNIVLCGTTGTGKTVAAVAMCEELKRRGFWVEFTTAFGMINSFLRGDFQNFIDCDVLVIDDLGTEPVKRNVSIEYTYAIINERLVNRNAFIITMNLAPADLMERYDQRIASRILAPTTSVIIEFKSPTDLRMKR
jgi:DNA replication protein DnaC